MLEITRLVFLEHNIKQLPLFSSLNRPITALRRPLLDQNRASKSVTRVLDELETRIRYENVGNHALSYPRLQFYTFNFVITSQLADILSQKTSPGLKWNLTV